jgi:hypothetical protein
MDFESLTTYKKVVWYEITLTSFLREVLPQWNNIELQQLPKRLLIAPLYFILQVNTQKVIYCSMFDQDGIFPKADFSLIEMHSYIKDIPEKDEGLLRGEDQKNISGLSADLKLPLPLLERISKGVSMEIGFENGQS